MARNWLRSLFRDTVKGTSRSGIQRDGIAYAGRSACMLSSSIEMIDKKRSCSSGVVRGVATDETSTFQSK